MQKRGVTTADESKARIYFVNRRSNLFTCSIIGHISFLLYLVSKLKVTEPKLSLYT